MPKVEDPKIIPEAELQIDYARSGGKGGQNVNKRSSKAQIRWNIGASKVFSGEEKDRIRHELANRINSKDEVLIESQEERSQEDNKRIGIGRLNRLIASALVVPEGRIPTKPTVGSRERRLAEKERRGRIKESRRKVVD